MLAHALEPDFLIRRTLAPTAVALAALALPAAGQCTVQEVPSTPIPTHAELGARVAVDGDIAVFSDPSASGFAIVGAVRVFRRDEGTSTSPDDDVWQPVVTWLGAPEMPNAAFGGSVSVSGLQLAVGWTGQGKVVLFDGEDGTFGTDAIFEKFFHPSFGRAVALDGDTLVAGAPLEPSTDVQAGAVWFFARDPATGEWHESGPVVASDAAPFARFGSDLALRGDTAVVGAPGDAARTGAAYVFARDRRGTPDPSDDVWIEVQKLVPPGAAIGDASGSQVSLDGDVLMVARPFASDTGPNAGAVHVYLRDDGATAGDPLDDTWTHAHTLSHGGPWLGGHFGRSLDHRGGRAVVGVDSAIPGLPATTGAVVPFERDDRGTADPSDDVWLERPALIPQGTTPGARVGEAVAVDGDWVMFGAPGQTVDGKAAGRGLVARWGLGCWTPLGTGVPGASAQVPQLTGVGVPEPGAAVQVDIAQGLGAAPGVLAIGGTPLALPAFGGLLWSSADWALVPHVLSGPDGAAGVGTATIPLAIPPEPALTGLRAYLQGAYLDASAPEGVALTAGLELRIG